MFCLPAILMQLCKHVPCPPDAIIFAYAIYLKESDKRIDCGMIALIDLHNHSYALGIV